MCLEQKNLSEEIIKKNKYKYYEFNKQKFLNEVLNQNVWFEGKQVAEILGYIAALAIPKETGNNLPSVSDENFSL